MRRPVFSLAMTSIGEMFLKKPVYNVNSRRVEEEGKMLRGKITGLGIVIELAATVDFLPDRVGRSAVLSPIDPEIIALEVRTRPCTGSNLVGCRGSVLQ